jgi:branched-chain amino acid transport system substrate-binding protein
MVDFCGFNQRPGAVCGPGASPAAGGVTFVTPGSAAYGTFGRLLCEHRATLAGVDMSKGENMLKRCTASGALFAVVAALAWQPAFAAGDILLGNVASTTSSTAGQNGTNLTLGYTIYLEQINGKGGVHGRKLKLLNKDDGVNVEKMLAMTDELVADSRVLALVGYLNTPGLGELIKRETLVAKKIAMIAPIGAMSATNFYPLRPSYNDEVDKLLHEALDTQKKRVALLYFNQTFGPGLSKFAEETAKKIGVNVVAVTSFEAAPDKIESSVATAAATLAKAEPDAVIIMSAGVGVYYFAKSFRQIDRNFAQLYAISPADAALLVKTAGIENARGVVISQALPYPQHNALAVVREYQKAMKQYAPDRPFSFYSLEGFMGAKIAVEALRRAGPNPTREKVIAALNTMKDFDLGDLVVSYTPERRVGSKIVDLTIIGKNGTLYR